EPVDTGVKVAHCEGDVVDAGQGRFVRWLCPGLCHDDSPCGIASIIDPLSRHGESDRLAQAWLVPRMMTVSPGRMRTSSTSVMRYTSPMTQVMQSRVFVRCMVGCR